MVIEQRPLHNKHIYAPIPRGTSYIIPITVLDEEEKPYDISGFDVYFTMKGSPSDDNFDDSHAVIQKQIKETYCDLAEGKISIHLTSRETWVIPGKYFFDVELVRGGSVIRLVSFETEVIGGPTNRTITSNDIPTVGGLGEEIVLILTKAQPIVCLNPFSGSIGGIEDIPDLPRDGAYVRKQSETGPYWAKLTTEEDYTQIHNDYSLIVNDQPTLGFRFSIKEKVPTLFQNIQDYYLCGKEVDSDIQFHYQRQGLIGDNNVGLFSLNKLLTYFPGKNTVRWDFELNTTGKDFEPIEGYFAPGETYELTEESYKFGIQSAKDDCPTYGTLIMNVTMSHYNAEEDIEYSIYIMIKLNFQSEYAVNLYFCCNEDIGIEFNGFHYIEEVPASTGSSQTYGRRRSADGKLSWVPVASSSIEDAPVMDHEAHFMRVTSPTSPSRWAESDPFTDAPDGQNYLRSKGKWVVSTSVEDAIDSFMYVRSKGTWIKTDNLPEVLDDNTYLRTKNNWVQSDIFNDAPDANNYVRSKGQWIISDNVGDVKDTKTYLRTKNSWVPSSIFTDVLDNDTYVRTKAGWIQSDPFNEAPVGGDTYLRTEGGWKASEVFKNPPDNQKYFRGKSGWILSDAMEDVTDNRVYVRTKGEWRVGTDFFVPEVLDNKKYVRTKGGWEEMNAILDAPDDQFYLRTRGGWVLTEDFEDAPKDGNTYVRANGAWIISAPFKDVSDTSFYVRTKGSWQKTDIFTEVPDYQYYLRTTDGWIKSDKYTEVADNNTYLRSKKGWVQSDPFAEAADGELYLRTQGGWVNHNTLYPPHDNNAFYVFVNTDDYTGWKVLDKATILKILNS